MILRKPYKFLIKNFRIIHILLAITSIYLLIKTNAILGFLNSYLKSTDTLVASGTASEYFNGLMTFLVIVMIAGTLLILFIMKMKDKPVVFYIINLAIYILVGIIYVYDSTTIQKLELSALDVRTIKLASDFTLICFMSQTLSSIILFVRGIGFDIKKFNFGEDLKLDITEKDNEEFEFDLNIDKNKIKRNIRKNIRNIKYTYHENKFLVNMIFVATLIIIGIMLFLNFEVFNKTYRKGQYINTINYSYNITDSYLINTDYKDNKITNNYLVVTKLNIKSKMSAKNSFGISSIQLHIGKTTYKPTFKYKNNLLDFGETYIKQNLTNDYEEYLVTFEIPKEYKNKKMYLIYKDSNNKEYKVRLKNTDFKTNKIKAKLNDYIKLNDELYKGIKFKISNYEINNKIKATYNFCETNTNCYESYEYIYPLYIDNHNKTILKIESDIDFNEAKIKNINDLSDFIEYYGKIKYVVNNEEKVMNTKIREVIPSKSNKKGVYYFEIYDDIKDATQISLILKIRNTEYEYVLK